MDKCVHPRVKAITHILLLLLIGYHIGFHLLGQSLVLSVLSLSKVYTF